MATLRVSVHIVEPHAITDHICETPNATWSPESCTLIYSAREAVLVDTAITIEQNKDLISWIDATAPGRILRYIYITHGHADHFLGLPQLLKHFPQATAVATAGTVEHMKQQLEEPFWTNTWVEFFGKENLYAPQGLATALGPENKFLLEDKWEFQAIECGQSDTYNSTVLWQPDLRLAVCGDVVYGTVHQMLHESRTKEKRQEWIRAVDRVKALNPMYVVPGHRRADEMDGVWHLENTQKYIQDFGEAREATNGNPDGIREIMMHKYSDRFNPMVLLWGCKGATLPDAS